MILKHKLRSIALKYKTKIILNAKVKRLCDYLRLQGVGESVASVRVVTWHKLTVRSKANRKSTIGNKTVLFKSAQNGNTNEDILANENVTVTTTLCNDNDVNDKNT